MKPEPVQQVDDDDEPDEWDQRIMNTGCHAENLALQLCHADTGDWRQCVKEMAAFRECWAKNNNDDRTSTVQNDDQWTRLTASHSGAQPSITGYKGQPAQRGGMEKLPFVIIEQILDLLDSGMDVGAFMMAIGDDHRYTMVHRALLTKSFELGTSVHELHNGLTLKRYAQRRAHRVYSAHRAGRVRAVASVGYAVFWVTVEVATLAFIVTFSWKMGQAALEAVLVLARVVSRYSRAVAAVVAVAALVRIWRDKSVRL